MACQTACRFYLKSLTSWGADLQGQQLPIFESFQFVVAYLHYCYYLFMGKRTLLARAAVPFPSLFSSFFSAAFPLGGASIISVNLDAFGVFECPHLYWATNIFKFDPSKLFMISKHDLLKRLWAFVHSHLIPTFVCSVGAQQTSFRICSTDLCVN